MAEVHTEQREGCRPAGGTPPSPQPGVCSASTQYGRPCLCPAQPGKDLCWSHDPQNAAKRVRNARAGGVAVHSPATLEIQELKEELKTLMQEVKDGKVAPGVASVITQLANVLLRGIEQERKMRETEELEERIRALEAGSGKRGAA